MALVLTFNFTLLTFNWSETTMPDHDPDIIAVLRQRLLQNALTLADGLDEAVPEAPLRERAAALGVLIDRLIKLGWTPEQEDDDHERVVRIEYTYPDGTTHQTPPWANPDYGGQGAFPSGSLRKAFRQDDSGEVDEP
jgi:hypothetical protein